LTSIGPDRPADLLVATETSDDAGVFRIAPDLALVQTVDFFPPVVDDPYTFGRIAAANALSDVFAMNGRPLTAMNIAAFPDDRLPLEILGQIIAGASERVTAAGASTVGGHTVRDAEIKFGLSVTGLVHPDEVLTNAGARPGDLLVLTKPLGTGFVTTAAKRRRCTPEVLDRAVAGMIRLNADGRDALLASGGAHALTDVTGYGLAGHALEMARGSNVTIELDLSALPIIEGTEALAVPRNFTRASATNRSFVSPHWECSPGIDRLRLEFALDAQTSGGLLIAVDPDHLDALLRALQARQALASAVIGRVLPPRSGAALSIR
jgi:selenide,water dikinase